MDGQWVRSRWLYPPFCFKRDLSEGLPGPRSGYSQALLDPKSAGRPFHPLSLLFNGYPLLPEDSRIIFIVVKEVAFLFRCLGFHRATYAATDPHYLGEVPQVYPSPDIPDARSPSDSLPLFEKEAEILNLCFNSPQGVP